MISRVIVVTSNFLNVAVAFSVDLSNPLSYEVPVEIAGTEAIVEGTIQGELVRFALDSGSHRAIGIPAHVLDRIAYDELPSTNRRLDSQGNVIRSRSIRVPEVILGPLILTNVVGTEAVFDPDYRPTTEAHLGRPIFDDYVVEVDLRGRKLTFHDERRTPHNSACSGLVIPFVADTDEPVTELQTELGPLVMAWDTGASTTVVRPSVFDGREALLDDDIYRTDNFQVGDVNLGSFEILTLDFEQPKEIDGFIGFNFFVRHTVCFDMGRQVIVVVPDQ